MAEPKSGEPFGLDQVVLKAINWDLALERIIHDLRSDFIYAPHLSFIYRRAGLELIKALKSELKAGTFFPGVPLTIEVPKSHRLRVAAPSKRFGPSFSRPGSILPPKERLFYQALADQAALIIDKKTDHQTELQSQAVARGQFKYVSAYANVLGVASSDFKKTRNQRFNKVHCEDRHCEFLWISEPAHSD